MGRGDAAWAGDEILDWWLTGSVNAGAIILAALVLSMLVGPVADAVGRKPIHQSSKCIAETQVIINEFGIILVAVVVVTRTFNTKYAVTRQKSISNGRFHNKSLYLLISSAHI